MKVVEPVSADWNIIFFILTFFFLHQHKIKRENCADYNFCSIYEYMYTPHHYCDLYSLWLKVL